MIPADGSYYVHYENNPRGPITKPVIAWDDEGRPLVAGKYGLVPAHELGSVKHIRQDDAPVVAAVPGGGWLIDCKDDDGNTWTTPILAWTIRADGNAVPLTADSDGVTDDATKGLAECRIYHPDTTDVQTLAEE